MGEKSKRTQFVLVHGACHGAWSWFKVKHRLESAGQRVTALDMAASGIHSKPIEAVASMKEYSQPLLDFVDSLPSDVKVILVGHSLGGLNIAYAMEAFPEKIAAGIFVAAFMPRLSHAPSYVLDQYRTIMPPENWLDTEFKPYQTISGTLTSMFFGPQFFAQKLYQLCSVQDLDLALTLRRTSSLFLEDLAKANKFSENGFGSVKKVYVICEKDEAIPVEFQHWMINNGDDESDVFKIPNSDHMPMLCTPQELCDVLLKIAHKYA